MDINNDFCEAINGFLKFKWTTPKKFISKIRKFIT